MKKIIAFLLVLVMVVPMMTFGAAADEAITADTSWYTGSSTSYTLTTAAQLLGLGQLAKSNNTFSGITVKLGADITLNTGDAAAWATTAPTNAWYPIKGFAGTFDGQGYTVSGLYTKGSSSSAFFSSCTVAAVVKNFSLVNSYFETTGSSAAGVCAGGGGTFQNIYCNAIVHCGDHHAGGIFGVGSSAIVVDSCWYDGALTMVKRFGAGIVGNGNHQPVTVTNCLNTGSVYTSYDEAAQSHIAGIVGRNDNKTIITGCVNLGKISSAYQESGKQDVIGSIFGACSLNTKTDDGTAWVSHVSISNSYASASSCVKAVGAIGSSDPSQLKDYTVLADHLLVGYSAQVNTGLDFNNIWTVDIDGHPLLRVFAEEVVEPLTFNAPTISSGIKTEVGNGTKWTVTVNVPSHFSKSDIQLGLLVVPSKAIPEGHTLSVADESFIYNSKICKVANIKADYVQQSASSQVIATFVLTDLEGANALTTFTAVPYALYKTGNASVEVYGSQNNANYYRQATLAKASADTATKAKIEADLAPINAQLGGSFPVTSSWSTMTLFETVPAVTFGTVSAPVDYGVENYVVTVTGATKANYDTYCSQMVQFGFTKHSASSLHSNTYNTSFIKNEVTVNVTYLAKISAMYVSVSKDLPLSDHLFNNFSQDVGAVANESLTMMQLWNWGNSIVIQLKNGHFLMNDGGVGSDSSGQGELPYFLDYIETLVPEGEKPVIDAWFFSHMHWDHSCSVHGFVDNPEWCDRVIVEGFYFSEPNSTVKDMDPGVYGQIEKTKKAISMLKNSKGETPEMYRPQTGQRYYFSDMTVDVLLCQEQIPSNTYYDKYNNGGNNFNESSTWLRFNIGNQDVLIAGDTDHAGMQKMMDIYDKSVFNFDVFFAFHHGSNTWDTFTNYTTFKTVMFPYRTVMGGTANNTMKTKATRNGGEVIGEGEGNVVLTFPYTVGTYTRLPSNTWIYNIGATRP